MTRYRRVWVRVAGNGLMGDPFRPDLPPGVGNVDIDFATELDHTLPGRWQAGGCKKAWADDDTPHRGDPASKFCRVTVAAEYVSKIDTVPENHIPTRDRLRVRVSGAMDIGRPDSVRELIDAAPTETDDDKAAALDALTQALYQGMMPRAANEIANTNALPTGERQRRAAAHRLIDERDAGMPDELVLQIAQEGNIETEFGALIDERLRRHTAR